MQTIYETVLIQFAKN